jgi:hypothetical protein
MIGHLGVENARERVLKQRSPRKGRKIEARYVAAAVVGLPNSSQSEEAGWLRELKLQF